MMTPAPQKKIQKLDYDFPEAHPPETQLQDWKAQFYGSLHESMETESEAELVRRFLAAAFKLFPPDESEGQRGQLQAVEDCVVKVDAPQAVTPYSFIRDPKGKRVALMMQTPSGFTVRRGC
jgi:hypothetical protein